MGIKLVYIRFSFNFLWSHLLESDYPTSLIVVRKNCRSGYRPFNPFRGCLTPPCFSRVSHLYTLAPEVLKIEKERDSIVSSPIPETAFEVWTEISFYYTVLTNKFWLKGCEYRHVSKSVTFNPVCRGISESLRSLNGGTKDYIQIVLWMAIRLRRTVLFYYWILAVNNVVGCGTAWSSDVCLTKTPSLIVFHKSCSKTETDGWSTDFFLNRWICQSATRIFVFTVFFFSSLYWLCKGMHEGSNLFFFCLYAIENLWKSTILLFIYCPQAQLERLTIEYILSISVWYA